MFITQGSTNSWLEKVLNELAEVIRLQDPGAIQLEMVTLAREHPDLRYYDLYCLLLHGFM